MLTESLGYRPAPVGSARLLHRQTDRQKSTSRQSLFALLPAFVGGRFS
jgi:hypothetical protein